MSSKDSGNLDLKRNEKELCEGRHFIHKKLVEWQLEEYIDAFDRERIDEPVSFFNVPNEVVANKLIKLAGPYTRFIIERERLKNSHQKDIEHTDTISTLKRLPIQVINDESPKRSKTHEKAAHSSDIEEVKLTSNKLELAQSDTSNTMTDNDISDVQDSDFLL